jgi:regulator of protease activity HflC (stomatin/prohibitin superfamily)
MQVIKEGQVGLLKANDGLSLPDNTVYAPKWDEPDKMKNAEYFLGEGGGYKGPQLTVLEPGTHPINTALFDVEIVPVTNVQAGYVAVIKSNVGEVVESDTRLVKKGQRGIWDTPLTEGKYYLNTKAYEVTMIDIRQTKVSYTAQKERGEIDFGQPEKPIEVRSKDGYTFPVDVRITYKIDKENAPRVVANIGDNDLVLNKIVTPKVRAIFRNNAGKVKALDYVQNRDVQEKQSATMLQQELENEGVTFLSVNIGDVGDEKSLGALLKTQTDREIALQQQTTFEEQQRAAEKQKALTKTTQEAEEEKRLATAAYGVKVAEEDKKKIIIDAQAEAEQIKLVAEAKAKAYQMVAEVIGADNAALVEIMKLVAAEDIQITPDVMVGGAGAGMTDALMGTILKDMLNKQSQ